MCDILFKIYHEYNSVTIGTNKTQFVTCVVSKKVKNNSNNDTDSRDANGTIVGICASFDLKCAV